MDLSVIVASGRSDPTSCLKSLIEQRDNFRHEVILVHDASNTPTERIDGVRYIECPTTNPATKRNIGASDSEGDVLAFIDDDAGASEGWAELGLATLAEHPLAAGCGGPNLPPDNQSAAERITDAVLASRLGSGSGSYRSGGNSHEAQIGEVHLVNFFVRRAVFDAVGGFSETLGYGAEDSEFIYLCSRMTRAAFMYNPDLWVTHRRRPFGRDFFSQRFQLRMQNGRLLWVRPGMYITRKSGLAITVLLALAWAAVTIPAIIPALMCIYAVVLGIASLKAKNVSKFGWILAIMTLHAVSALGLLAGVSLPLGEKYRRLLRRPR